MGMNSNYPLVYICVHHFGGDACPPTTSEQVPIIPVQGSAVPSALRGPPPAVQARKKTRGHAQIQPFGVWRGWPN